jgi:5-formyltetrahydrofolate cyclo-ligase
VFDSSIPVSKQTLRSEIKNRLAALPKGYFDAQGVAAAEMIRRSAVWEAYRTLLVFLSTAGEINISHILASALGEGKRVFAPRLEGKKMIFCRVRSPLGPWEQGPFGIPQPPRPEQQEEGAVLEPTDFPVLITAPGLAFDREGRRLGRGGAYYDRFLRALKTADLPFRTMGLCTPCQLVPEVPAEAWDQPMDWLCTGEAIFAV